MAGVSARCAPVQGQHWLKPRAPGIGPGNARDSQLENQQLTETVAAKSASPDTHTLGLEIER